MILANWNGHRMPAMARVEGATCPLCGAPVRAKLGKIVAWHWAHVAGADCDPWAEPDTQWHRTWQHVVPIERREVILGNHRADIVTPSGIVVELQRSSISVDEIREREEFYGRAMVWLFDATQAHEAGRFELRVKPNRSADFRSFRWKQARKSVAHCKRPRLLDLGDDVLSLRLMGSKAPIGGWGFLRTRADVVRFLNS